MATSTAQPFGDPCGVGIIKAEPCPRELGREIPAQRRRVVLAACVLASSMAFIDSSVLTVALPSLRAAFDADLGTVQWIMNGYLLALAALTLIGGALADAHGKARVLAGRQIFLAVCHAGVTAARDPSPPAPATRPPDRHQAPPWANGTGRQRPNNRR